MTKKKNILVCPLDWGLGHATRMVPVIKEICRQGVNVVIAADNAPRDFLMSYFPELTHVKLEGYTPRYPADGSMAWAMIRSIPQLVKSAIIAKRKLVSIIDEYQIDAIISDNRYELSSSKVLSVFVTHQLNIQTSGFQKLASPLIGVIIFSFLKNYSEIWVPDNISHALSGDLSKLKRFKEKTYFVGALSRFNEPVVDNVESELDLLIQLSGPEPQRSILEELLLKQVLDAKLRTVILQGKPHEAKVEKIDNVTLISHATDQKIISLVGSAKNIICRPGYSTLMDLAKLGRNAIFIPTPGQTEQEYLANKLLKEGIAFSQVQQSFNLTNAIEMQKSFSGLLTVENGDMLEERISNLLNNC